MRKYRPEDVHLRVSAGTSHASSRHVEISVNRPTPVCFSSDLIDVELCVRIKDHKGLPDGSPSTCAYFDEAAPAKAGNLYSIAFRFRLKEPPSSSSASPPSSPSSSPARTPGEGVSRNGLKGIKAADLQWGNSFERPVRAHLPPGFNAALRIAKWLVDPGLEGDIYADKPFLYGPALSSINTVRVGRGVVDDDRGGLVVEEGADEEDGWERRRTLGVPDESSDRMKWALRRGWDGSLGMDPWVWEYGTDYAVDFGNGYIDFSGFNLCLPGYNLSVLKVWDGQPFTYVLRNRASGQVYFVVVFDLLVAEELDEQRRYKHGNVVRKGIRSDEPLGGNASEGANDVDDAEDVDEVDEAVLKQAAGLSLDGEVA